MADLAYLELSPEPELAPYVECFWSLSARTETSNVILPDGCIDLVFSPVFGLRVAGPMTRRQLSVIPAKSRVAGIRFRPGMARAFLKITPLEIRDTLVEAETLWPKRARQMEDRLIGARSDRETFRWLRDSIGPVPDALDGLQRSLLTLARGKGRVDLEEIVGQTNLSARQFRRRCVAESGLSPKYLNRILRFREARALALAQGKTKWAEIAVEAGYFDQSHLIRDFIEFAGAAPAMSVLSNI